MGYDKHHVAVLSSEEGYSLLASTYKQYHKHLDERDKWIVQRFLPRNLAWLSVIDVGAGDGRLAKYVVGKWLSRYVAVDCSQPLLNRAPGRCEKVISDITQPLPFDPWTFDIGLCFFVLVHVESLRPVFAHLRHVTKEGWRLLVLHHLERRAYVHSLPWKTFKIASRYHSFETVSDAAQKEGRREERYEVDEQTNLYIFTAT